MNVKLKTVKALNTQELIFLGVTHRMNRQLIETGTILYLLLPLRVLISPTAFLFWGTVASLLIQLCNTAGMYM